MIFSSFLLYTPRDWLIASVKNFDTTIMKSSKESSVEFL